MSRAPASRSILLESLVNHVALPPRLPGKEDNNLDQIQYALTGYLIDARGTLRDSSNGEFSREWESVRTILHTCKILNTGGKLNKTSLVTHFRNLDRKDHLILHIAEQNAGLLIQRQHE
ncbi:hypothetical protein GJ744_006518 [Endocarpon pusillum]|uniref:DUF6606 domain-containing protein n=1 Tax=Endocarpon pusillum TaxID=364733 RepID=A0A8H7AUR7_9EURO|nr:hypothetical protein GJ744_006518 [Endocarpon pusillum]